MRRRAAAPLVACALLGPAAPAADERPSFVFFLSDDHAERAISACGSDLVETPSIDRIAAEGVRFRNSFVANSICAPARATILTGTYSHVNGVVSNAERFDGTQPTLPALLRDAGYQTALIGKWHLKSDPVGFDHWEILPGQGSYYNPDFRTPAGTERRRGYVTDLITDAALRWLEEERDPARPFLLLVWHKAPHRAWLPGPDHLSTYDDVVFPEPPTLFDDLSGRGTAARLQEMTIARHLMDGYDLKLWPDDPDAEAWGRAWTYGRMDDAQRARWHATYDPLNAAFRAAAPTGDDLVRWKYQRYLHDYLACIASVDDGVGRVLDALEVPRGPDGGALSDRTAVVYSSDQGFYLGEHGWYDKRWLYEESLRTPLLVRGPGRAAEGSVVDALVSNVDVAPTFLDLAGVPIPARMQGRSLVPFLRGASPPDWRDAIYSQYFEGAGKAHNVHRHHGLRTDRWKLIRYDGLDEWELFDLATDPHELRSLHDAPEHAAIRDDLVARLAAMRRSLGVEEGGVPLDEVVPAGIEVPRADLARPPEEGVFTKALVLGVTSDGGYVLDGDPVGFEAVERRLRAWTDTPVPWGGPAWTEDAWSTRHVVVAADERAPWPAVARVFERGRQGDLRIDRCWCAARGADGSIGVLPFHGRGAPGAAEATEGTSEESTDDTRPASGPREVIVGTGPVRPRGAFEEPTQIFHALGGRDGRPQPNVLLRIDGRARAGTVIATVNELRRFGSRIVFAAGRDAAAGPDAGGPWIVVRGAVVPDDPARPSPGEVVAGDPRRNPPWRMP